jgi:signal transduction histidine kinase
MKKKIANQFLTHYLVVFVMVILSTVLSFSLMSFASQLASDLFAKNKYPASSIMQDDYNQIDTAQVVQNGGSVQVIDKEYRVVVSQGKDAIPKKQLTAAEFTEFLRLSKDKNTPFNHDIMYNPQGKFWLIVTFPASIWIDFNFIINMDAATGDFGKAALVFSAVIIVYLVLIAVITFIYARITASQITVPLRKLCDGTRLLREGDYSVRVDLRLKNEFAELQDTFNDMASRIEHEISMRKKSEDDRRRLILDISHDLKNPMSSIQGYAERLCQKDDISEQVRREYLQIIYKNSQRANRLLNGLFELSKIDSPDFSLKTERTDICEFLRQQCGELVPQLEQAGFKYEFDIPEESIFVMLDTDHFSRIIQNLASNTLRYNKQGTTVTVCLSVKNNQAVIDFGDDGIGIPAHLAQDIFKSFVRADESRNSETGGSGLGLAIAKKIAQAHGGDLTLCEYREKGCTLRITIPII